VNGLAASCVLAHSHSQAGAAGGISGETTAAANVSSGEPEAQALAAAGASADSNVAATTALVELVAIVDRLRDPAGGCPWDLEQTHHSLIPYVLEEAHEVADAIRQGDPESLQDELGDLLLQVVLHARIASEAGQFDLAAIARGISAKLVRRHPHVFAGAEAADSAAVRRLWQAIKAEEQAERRGQVAATTTTTTAATVVVDEGPPPTHRAAQPLSPLSDQLARKVRGQPALAGAMTISRQAAAAGFEWDDLDGVWAKVHEELDELKEAVALAWSDGGIPAGSPGRGPTSGDSAARAHAETELGDVLFTLVNVGRWCRLDPEEGLAGTNRRFLDRFSRLEAALGGDLGGRSLGELEQHWQQAKAAIRAEAAHREEA
jgi:XTP/dITP diphosphohydrolase